MLTPAFGMLDFAGMTYATTHHAHHSHGLSGRGFLRVLG
jgi:hypothetical protein